METVVPDKVNTQGYTSQTFPASLSHHGSWSLMPTSVQTMEDF